MKEKVNLIAIKEIPLIKAGDNIPQIIFNALKLSNLALENGDILVIAQTIISKSLGRTQSLNQIKPSQKAIEIYKKIAPLVKKNALPEKSPELIQAILDESAEVIKTEHVMIVETYHGFVCANAGIDKSNVEGKDEITLLPLDSDKEAEKIRISLQRLTGKKIAVIISDSFGRSFRIGSVGVALGCSGINPILDKRGSKDLYGNELQSTIMGQIDNLASAAQLIMGEADEGQPAVVIRGYDFNITENTSIKQILRKREIDLFRDAKFRENFEALLKSRRSYKLEFSNKKLDESIIKECIEIARWAPSAHNGQFWRYIIMEQGKLRETLIKNINFKLGEDLLKDGKSKNFIKKKIEKTRNQFLRSPYLILLCLDTQDLEKYSDQEREKNEYIMGVQSISASATYLLLAFEIREIAACWYCAPLFTKEIIRNTLNLPSSFIPMAFFTIGQSLKTQQIPKRKELKDIIFKV